MGESEELRQRLEKLEAHAKVTKWATVGLLVQMSWVGEELKGCRRVVLCALFVLGVWLVLKLTGFLALMR